MVLIDAPTLILVLTAVAAAAIAGKSRDTALLLVNAIILPAGMTATFIGAVLMLHVLDDPASIFPGTAVALLSVVYTAAVKIAVEVFLSKRTTHAQVSRGKHGFVGATIWCTCLIGAVCLGGVGFCSFINLPALLLVGLSIGAIIGITKAAGTKSYLHQIVRYIPSAGLFILYASGIAVMGNLHDPTAIGPYVAMGLLGYLYTSVLYTVVILIRPEVMPRGPQASQWLYWAGSLGGFAFYFVLVSRAF
jgi:hypothetical protein